MKRPSARWILFGTLSLLILSAPGVFAQGAGPLPAVQAHGIIGTLAYYAERAIRAIGYPGVFLAMAAESMFIPIPAEAVMPFTGFLVADGTFRFEWVFIVAAMGSLAGSLVSYYIGAWGGKPFVNKLGKYVLLDRRDLEATERFFSRRGEVTIFVSRLIPVARHLISLPAGASRMNLPRFVIFTIAGAGLYDAFLAVVGFYLRDNWSSVMRYSHTIDAVAILLCVAVVVLYVYRHLRRRASDRKAEARP